MSYCEFVCVYLFFCLSVFYMFGPVLVMMFKFVCMLVFSCLSLCMCVYQAIEFSCCTVVPLRSTVPPSPSIIHPPGARLRCCYSSSSFKIEIHIHLDDCVQQTVPHVWKLRINLLFPICPVFFSFDFWLNTAGWYMGVERVMGFCIFFPNWWKVQREWEREAERVWEGWAARAPGLRQAAAWFTRWFPPNDALPQCTTLQHLLGKVENLQSSKYKTLLSHSATGG